MIDTATFQAFAAFLAVWVAALGLQAGFVYWHFRDIKEEFQIEIRRLDDKIDRSHAESLAEMRQIRQEFIEELRRTREELLAEMRRGNAQLLVALNGHTHDADTGAAVYRELPAADDD